jgi:hypothetical protein
MKIGLQGLVKLGELRPQNLIEEPFGCANHDRVAPLPIIAIWLHAITPAQDGAAGFTFDIEADTARQRGKLMSKPLSALLAGIALIGLVPVTEANAVTINLGSAGVPGGAKFIADEGKIKFAPNVSGETATFILDSTPGTQYTISVTGQTNQSSSFAQFLIDADGPGPYTITLPTFTDLGTSDSS